ncbi:acyltransferase [Sphingomonas sp. TREG-RG-20F-R18-01]|uniref:acyltransferase family protein n=1 Tax=Sphingomonas sp. TREG-RG-20F-R18-01 TaxID=2914982 RepID=UPI001F562EEC|nr:acyltransferase [Sphingomonas sp. TREG-RG-20F-R18-01]
MIKNIQALRAVAALLVVVDHWAALYGGWFQRLGAIGAVGVDIFFVISGFVMIHATAGRTVSPSRFAVSRIIRIVPLYWTFTIALFLGAVIAPNVIRSTTTDLAPLLKSLFFVPYEPYGPAWARRTQVSPLLFTGWTLNYEMFFYAIFALSLFLRNVFWQRAAVLAVLGVLVVIGLVGRPTGFLMKFYTASLLLEFAYGMVLGMFAEQWLRLIRNRGVAWALVAVGLSLLLAMMAIFPVSIRGYVLGPFALLTVVGALALERQGVAVRSRLWLLLGAASYAIYLVHLLSTVIVVKALAHVPVPGPAGVTVRGVTTVVAACGIGVAIHLLYERPLGRWLQERLPPRIGRAAGKIAPPVIPAMPRE